MNVLYITNTIDIYGANNSLMDMVEELKERNVNIYIITMRNGKLTNNLKKCGFKTYVIPYETNAATIGVLKFREKCERLIKNIHYLPEIKKIIDTNHIDIIHSNASNVDIGAMAAIRYKIPHIFHVREVLYKDFGLVYDFPMISRFFLNRASKIIAISEYVKKEKKLGPNSTVIYNGFNMEKYCISKADFFPDTKLHILYCGVISRQKGIMDIIKAIHYLVTNGREKIELSIVGGESPYWQKVDQYIRKNQLENYIHYYGYQYDLLPFRRKADIAIMSSRSEALGRVTIESMLGEVLVIGANCGATSELIKNKITGYLYEPGNIKQLAMIISNVKQNKPQNVEIIRNAKQFALGTFDRKDYADKLLKLYTNLLLSKK